MPAPTPHSPALVGRTRDVTLQAWASDLALAGLRRNLGRGTTRVLLTPEALLATGIPAAALLDYSRLTSSQDLAGLTYQQVRDAALLEAEPFAASLLVVADTPGLSLRAGVGWVLAAAFSLGESTGWLGEDAVLSVMATWSREIAPQRPRLEQDWLYLAAGIPAREVAAQRKADPEAVVDEPALLTLAALHGHPTPAPVR